MRLSSCYKSMYTANATCPGSSCRSYKWSSLVVLGVYNQVWGGQEGLAFYMDTEQEQTGAVKQAID